MRQRLRWRARGSNLSSAVAAEVLERRVLMAADVPNAIPNSDRRSDGWYFGQIENGSVPFSIDISPDHLPILREADRTPCLPDPMFTAVAVGYRNFSSVPLFNEGGPVANDVQQGSAADCYLMVVLSSVARLRPAEIEQLVADGGDDTYTVRFTRAGNAVDIRVDADLPVNSAGEPVYAQAGGTKPLWPAIVEKAYSLFRVETKSYAALDLGWMDETYTAIGITSHSTFSAPSSESLLNSVDTALAAGEAVTYGTRTPAPGSNLVAGHAYTVNSIERDEEGTPVYVNLRNPWGTDGNATTDGLNDGYLKVSAIQFFDSMVGYVEAFL